MTTTTLYQPPPHHYGSGHGHSPSRATATGRVNEHVDESIVAQALNARNYPIFTRMVAHLFTLHYLVHPLLLHLCECEQGETIVYLRDYERER
jgi:hypothetical protein